MISNQEMREVATQIVATQTEVIAVRETLRGQIQIEVRLANGYRASILGGRAHGGFIPLQEVGIMNRRGTLIYGTPVAPYDAVVRYGEVSEILGILAQIAELSPNIDYPTHYVYTYQGEEE